MRPHLSDGSRPNGPLQNELRPDESRPNEPSLIEPERRVTLVPPKADLHIHSTFSDGSKRPEELVALAVQQGMTHLSLTDHDTTNGLFLFRTLMCGAGLTPINGIEISTTDPITGRETHILGYHFRLPAVHIEAVCREQRQRRHRNSLWQIDRIRRAGYSITEQEVQAIAGSDHCIYKQHIMQALLARGYCDQLFGELYARLFSKGGLAHRPLDYIPTPVAIYAILRDGGLPVLAHPVIQGSHAQIKHHRTHGLCGIEINHHSHSDADRAELQGLALEWGLFMTGGTDFHGHYGRSYEPSLGVITSPNNPLLLPAAKLAS